MLDRERAPSENGDLGAMHCMAGPVTGTPIHSIRIARPEDSNAVSALLAASYSSLLAARYDSDALGRALPFMTSANPILLASGTYYVAEREPGHLVGCGGWTTARPGSGEIIEGERTSVTLQLIPGGWGEESGLPCLPVASAKPGNSAFADCTAFRH
jgi:hypothetical protein